LGQSRNGERMSERIMFGNDLQASTPEVRIGLSRAGVTGVQKAVRMRHGDDEALVAAEIDCFVDLDPAQKGVHMSRFPELFEEAIDEVVMGEKLLVEHLAGHIAEHILGRQKAIRAEVRIAARYPLERTTPVTGLRTQELVTLIGVAAAAELHTRRAIGVEATGIRAQLKGTTRAVQIAGDGNQLLAGTLRPGDRIDVVANLEYKVSDVVAGGAGSAGSAADVDRVATRIILRDIKVLKTSGGAGTSAKISRASNSSWVILAVTDGQAQKLFFVVQNGEWTLQLRPTLRAADSPESVETIETVLGDGLKLGQFRQLYAGRTPRD